MELRELIARILCDRGGSWDTARVFARGAGEENRERADWYRRQADAYIAKYAPSEAKRGDEQGGGE